MFSAYVYKQVPQNMEANQQPDLLPEFEDQQQEQFAGLKPENEVKTSEKKGQQKRIYSDTNKEWSELIRELNAEKNDKTSPRVSSDFQGCKIEPIFETPQEYTSKHYKTKSKWLDIIEKHKAQKQRDLESGNVDTPEEKSLEFDVTAGGSLQTVAQQSAQNKKENLPELLQGIQVDKASTKPELLGYGAPGTSRDTDISPIPELLQDIGSNKDDTGETETESQNKRSSGTKESEEEDASSDMSTVQEDRPDDAQKDDQDQDEGGKPKD